MSHRPPFTAPIAAALAAAILTGLTAFPALAEKADKDKPKQLSAYKLSQQSGGASMGSTAGKKG